MNNEVWSDLFGGLKTSLHLSFDIQLTGTLPMCNNNIYGWQIN